VAELPTATVTFTNIEGSTRLLIALSRQDGPDQRLQGLVGNLGVVAINDAPDRRADRRALGHKGPFLA
jgi:hypothetical protein